MSKYKALIGKAAPQFKLKNYDGSDYDVKPGEKGIPMVIFFYPQAGECTSIWADQEIDDYQNSGSTGCTGEACQFRDAVAGKPQALSSHLTISLTTGCQPIEKINFSAENVEIIGISPDPVEKQEAFVTKHKLTVIRVVNVI
jgi:peroxiredoxin Q/BCP